MCDIESRALIVQALFNLGNVLNFQHFFAFLVVDSCGKPKL